MMFYFIMKEVKFPALSVHVFSTVGIFSNLSAVVTLYSHLYFIFVIKLHQLLL